MSSLGFLGGLVLGVAIVWAFVRRRRALRETIETPSLDDAAVDRIIREGVIRVEDPEPLDLEEIARAEEDFWDSEGWDPAEEGHL